MELVALLESLGYQPLPITTPKPWSIRPSRSRFFSSTFAATVTRCERCASFAPAATHRRHGLADPAKPSAAADAIRAGVFDVLLPDHPLHATWNRCWRTLANNRAAAMPAHVRPPDASPMAIVGHSPAMRAVMDLVQRAAAGRCGLLICGERGSGRETIARAIRALGPQRDAPFVVVDGLNTDSDDAEQQLFGEPSPDNAGERRPPRLRAAVAREPAVRRGGRHLVPRGRDRATSARPDAARSHHARPRGTARRPERAGGAGRTRHRHRRLLLEAALEEGRLRRDLYERLSLIRIDAPPLRQRREDLPALATHFLKDACRRTRPRSRR